MFNLKKKIYFNNSVTSFFSKPIASLTLIALLLSSQLLSAETSKPPKINQKKIDSGSDLNKEAIFKKIKSSRDQIQNLSNDANKELEEQSTNLNSLREVIGVEAKEMIHQFIEKARGMNFEGLKSQWKFQNSQQEQAFNKLVELVNREQKKLNNILFRLKTTSTKLEDVLTYVESQIHDFEKLIPSLPGISGVLQSRITTLMNLTEGAERNIRKQLNDQIERADELHEVFETFIRTKWSLMYDTSKVMDRFFLANDPLGDSVFMLKSKTSGIIKEIKKRSFEIAKNSFQNVYFLKVEFSELCSNKDSCETEELWIEYNSELNLKLNRPLLITSNSRQGMLIDKGDEIQIGSKISINEDGVTAFTSESSLDTQPFSGSDDTVSFNTVIQKKMVSVKNDDYVSNKRNLAETQVPGQSRAGQLINAANGFAVSCQEYIQKNNQFGTIGKAILKNVNRDSTPVLFQDDIGDLKVEPKKICPNYLRFSQAEKADFMVYYAAAIGMAESSCNSHVKAKGPNGTLIGQWQLHLGKTHVYAGGVCGKINPSIGAQNTVCGMKMLNFYTKMPKNTKNELFYSRNYWETMHYPRPGAKKALAMIHKFPGCFSR